MTDFERKMLTGLKAFSNLQDRADYLKENGYEEHNIDDTAEPAQWNIEYQYYGEDAVSDGYWSLICLLVFPDETIFEWYYEGLNSYDEEISERYREMYEGFANAFLDALNGDYEYAWDAMKEHTKAIIPALKIRDKLEFLDSDKELFEELADAYNQWKKDKDEEEM